MNDHALDPLVLLIEDEAAMRKLLRVALGAHSYRVIEAESGTEGLRLAATNTPDIVLLDLGLPDLDGLEVTAKLRERTTVPIVVISARGREADKIRALDLGADDYVTKPFGVGELLARMRVARRHAAARGVAHPEPVLRAGDIVVDVENRTVHRGDAEVHLTPLEYKLLVVLLRNEGKVLTHRQLLRDVWGPSYAGQTQYLRVYMGQLRHKLEADPARPRHLFTEPGVGYRLRAE